MKKVAGTTTTRYIFSGTRVIAEYVSGSLSKEYIYSGSGLLAALDSGGTPTYHHSDHLSARVNTNSSGTTVGQQGHYPFGESWYCAFYTRINSDPQPKLGHHIQGSLHTAKIETRSFNTDAGFLELQSDYWDHWDSYTTTVDHCALAQCLRGKVVEFDAITERPYKAFADGKHPTTLVHSNSSSFIGALVDSCAVPSPTPTLGNISARPLVRTDYKQGFAGWHYWERAKPPAEFWKQVSSAKRLPTIHPYSPGWLIALQFKLWWYT